MVDEAVLAHRSTQGDAGARIDVHAAWSFSEIMHTAEAHLRALDKQTTWLSEVGLGMAAALWLGIVAPNSFTRLARWLEAGLTRLQAWCVSVARARADLALRFIMYWYPGLNLDQLAAERAGAEAQLAAEAGRIAARASYIGLFAVHENFQVEWTEDVGEVLPDNFGLTLDDPAAAPKSQVPMQMTAP